MAVDERAAVAELKRRVGCVAAALRCAPSVQLLTAALSAQRSARGHSSVWRRGRRVPPLPGRAQVGRGQGGGAAARGAGVAERAVPRAQLPGPSLRTLFGTRGRCLTPAAAQANPPRARLALVRSLLPANPHLGFSKEGWPVTLINVGASDPAKAAGELTGDDLVRYPSPATPAARPVAPFPADGAPVCAVPVQVADLVVRAEFYTAVVFPEASKLAGASSCARRRPQHLSVFVARPAGGQGGGAA
jgi:hypothetical protein